MTLGKLCHQLTSTSVRHPNAFVILCRISAEFAAYGDSAGSGLLPGTPIIIESSLLNLVEGL
jgi:hypothetical protein